MPPHADERARRGAPPRLYARRCAATDEHLNPILLEAPAESGRWWRRWRPSTLALYESFGYDPAGLHRATQAYLAETEDLYRRTWTASCAGGWGSVWPTPRPADLGRLWRAPEFDAGFAPERALPALRATLAELGIDLDRAAERASSTSRPRPNKRPRAFCAPIRVPERVVLVILPQGGQDDYQALFHEAGHTEHFAHTSPDLPAEARILGDNARHRGVRVPARASGVGPRMAAIVARLRPVEEYVRFCALVKLFFVRRYAAKLAYELDLHSGAPLASLPGRYAELLGAAVGVPYPPTDYLEDVDGGFYCTCYLRAWAFEAQLRDHLRGRFGTEWFRRRKAGDLLRELWSLGQAQRAEQLLQDVTGAELEFGVLAAEAREALG